MPTYFSDRSFRFQRALARNNNRAWFHAHKDDYEQYLRQPFLRLISDLREPLAQISPHFRADPRPVGGSLFRIHRDTRFANDKTPYKSWASARLYHERIKTVDSGRGQDRRDTTPCLPWRGVAIDAPSFYLRIAPGGCLLGGGLWQPETAVLRRIRDFIVENPRSWTQLTRAPAFRRKYELIGSSLARPPRGYPPGHELIADLQRKSFAATRALADEVVAGPRLLKTVSDGLRGCAPLVDYLCAALELPF